MTHETVQTEQAWQFRTATRADVPQVVALVESAYRGDASRAGWTTEAEMLDGQRTDADDVLSKIEGERSLILLAERDGRLGASRTSRSRTARGTSGCSP